MISSETSMVKVGEFMVWPNITTETDMVDNGMTTDVLSLIIPYDS